MLTASICSYRGRVAYISKARHATCNAVAIYHFYLNTLLRHDLEATD